MKKYFITVTAIWLILLCSVAASAQDPATKQIIARQIDSLIAEWEPKAEFYIVCYYVSVGFAGLFSAFAGLIPKIGLKKPETEEQQKLNEEKQRRTGNAALILGFIGGLLLLANSTVEFNEKWHGNRIAVNDLKALKRQLDNNPDVDLKAIREEIENIRKQRDKLIY